MMEFIERTNRGIKVKQFQRHSPSKVFSGAFREIDSESFRHKRTIETSIRRDYRNVIKTNAILN